MKLFFTITLFIAVLISKAQVYNGPESVEFDYSNNRWLISNTSSHTVLARDSAGVLSTFVTGLVNGPYGIEIVGDTLYCCSGSSIKGFLLADGSQVFNVNLGASFLNGITHDQSGNLIITDYSAKEIYKLNINSLTFSVIATSLTPSPNGIIFDAANNRCVFVNWGSNAPVKAINMSTYSVTTLTPTTLGSCDGIARDGQGRYYISNWSGQSVVRFDSTFSAPPIVVASNLDNPADIFYNVIQDTLAIPNSGNNTVDFIGFSTVDVNEINISHPVKIFADNLNGQLTIELSEISNSHLSISDINGRLCLSQYLDESRNTYIVDINNLNPGMYFASFIFNDKKITRKRFLLK